MGLLWLNGSWAGPPIGLNLGHEGEPLSPLGLEEAPGTEWTSSDEISDCSRGGFWGGRGGGRFSQLSCKNM